jgi:hypothetical protein
MTKNLEKADTVVKLTLALSVILFYLTHIIRGPSALVITLLATFTILIFVVRFIYSRVSRKNKRY